MSTDARITSVKTWFRLLGLAVGEAVGGAKVGEKLGHAVGRGVPNIRPVFPNTGGKPSYVADSFVGASVGGMVAIGAGVGVAVGASHAVGASEGASENFPPTGMHVTFILLWIKLPVCRS
jgi:hypothetical protein